MRKIISKIAIAIGISIFFIQTSSATVNEIITKEVFANKIEKKMVSFKKPNGNILVIGRGENNKIWFNTYTASSAEPVWQGWQMPNKKLRKTLSKKLRLANKDHNGTKKGKTTLNALGLGHGIKDVEIAFTAKGRLVIFFVTAAGEMKYIFQKANLNFSNVRTIPHDREVKEIESVLRFGNHFEVLALGEDERLWQVTFNIRKDHLANNLFAPAAQIPECNSYLPFNQLNDDLANRTSLTFSTPGTKFQGQSFVASFMITSTTQNLFFDQMGALALAGCQPAFSVMGDLDNMGTATNTYNSEGQIIQQTGSSGGVNYNLQYIYNNSGYFLEMRNGFTNAVCSDASYDELNRVTSVRTMTEDTGCANIYSQFGLLTFFYPNSTTRLPQSSNYVGSQGIGATTYTFNTNNITLNSIRDGIPRTLEYQFVRPNNQLDFVNILVNGNANNSYTYFYDTDKYGYTSPVIGFSYQIDFLPNNDVVGVTFGFGPAGLAYGLVYD